MWHGIGTAVVIVGGGWQFDPTTQRIVQLDPIGFWEFAAGTLAGLSVVIGLAVIAATTFVLRRIEPRAPTGR